MLRHPQCCWWTRCPKPGQNVSRSANSTRKKQKCSSRYFLPLNKHSPNLEYHVETTQTTGSSFILCSCCPSRGHNLRVCYFRHKIWWLSLVSKLSAIVLKHQYCSLWRTVPTEAKNTTAFTQSIEVNFALQGIRQKLNSPGARVGIKSRERRDSGLQMLLHWALWSTAQVHLPNF